MRGLSLHRLRGSQDGAPPCTSLKETCLNASLVCTQGSDAREVVLRIGASAAALAVKRAHESQVAGLNPDLMHVNGSGMGSGVPPTNRRRLNPAASMNGQMPEGGPPASNGHASVRPRSLLFTKPPPESLPVHVCACVCARGHERERRGGGGRVVCAPVSNIQ
jgi:hypothetical protein